MAKKDDDAISATIKEQGSMRPVPSQEDADNIKIGKKLSADEKQPKGPAQAAEDEKVAANERAVSAESPAPYKTRASKSE